MFWVWILLQALTLLGVLKYLQNLPK